MVDESVKNILITLGIVDAYCREPLPVAVMSKEGRESLSSIVCFCCKMDVMKFHVLFHLLGSHGEKLYGLHEIVAKPMVEFPLYLL